MHLSVSGAGIYNMGNMRGKAPIHFDKTQRSSRVEGESHGRVYSIGHRALRH
jgi:hypothetical protein